MSDQRTSAPETRPPTSVAQMRWPLFFLTLYTLLSRAPKKTRRSVTSGRAGLWPATRSFQIRRQPPAQLRQRFWATMRFPGKDRKRNLPSGPTDHSRGSSSAPAPLSHRTCGSGGHGVETQPLATGTSTRSPFSRGPREASGPGSGISSTSVKESFTGGRARFCEAPGSR